VQGIIIQTIQIKIYNKRIGQILHKCPFHCCHTHMYLPLTTVSAHISKFRSAYAWKFIYIQLTGAGHLPTINSCRWK